MPLSPPILPSLCPHSHASCLPRLVVVLPLVLRRLSFSSCHHLLSGGASTCPFLVAPPPLVMPLFFSGVLASHPPRLFVVSPLIMPPPPVHLRLRLSLHCCLSLGPSHVSYLASYHIASHPTDASCPPVPLTLIAPLPLFAPLSCLSSNLAGCRVAFPHDGASSLPAPLPPRNSL